MTRWPCFKQSWALTTTTTLWSVIRPTPPTLTAQEVTTPVGQYAYSTPDLLAKRGVTEAARDPLRLLTAPPKVLLTPVEEMEAAFYKGTPVSGEG